MGLIRDSFGRISIESRSESFYIHAGYGYGLAHEEIGTLRPGQKFFADGREFKVNALYEGKVEARDVQFNAFHDFAPSCVVRVVGSEDFDEDVPLAKFWRDVPHPEFAIEDLDDLIAALVDFRDSRRG